MFWNEEANEFSLPIFWLLDEDSQRLSPRYIHYNGGIAITPKGHWQSNTFSTLAITSPQLEASIVMAAEYSKQPLGGTTVNRALVATMPS